MFNFLLHKIILFIFAVVPILLSLYQLLLNPYSSKLMCVVWILFGTGFLVYGWDYDRRSYRVINRKRKISNLIFAFAVIVYILKVILDSYV